MDERIAAAYSGVLDRDGQRTEIGSMAAEWAMPRHAITFRANALGLASRRKIWTDAEKAYLRANAGLMGIDAIAKHLGRSFPAVKCAACSLGLRLDSWKGYTRKDVARILHVAPMTIEQWTVRGWLRRDAEGMFTQPELEHFLRGRLRELDLRRIDQDWLRETLADMLQTLTINDTYRGYDLAVNPGAYPHTRKAA